MYRLKIEKRLETPRYFSILIPVFSVALSLFLMGITIWAVTGKLSNTLEAYREMFSWPFTPGYGLSDTIQKMVPLMLTGLGLIVVFRMRIWNIGAEGQLYLGAMATTWGALFLLKDFQNPLVVPTLLILGTMAGAFWGVIPGILKAFLNLDEIVATLMLNYVAYYWVNYLIYGPWKDPHGYNFPLTAMFPEHTWLPDIGDTGVHLGVFIALGVVVVVHVILNRTRWGFDLKVIGDNEKAARYAGIDTRRNIILAMMLSGALAGLAGAIQMLGVQHRLQHGFSPGYGYTGIIIAWLSRLNPWAVILVSFLFGGLIVGSEQLQIIMRIPISLINVLQGIMLFSLLASETAFRYRMRIVKGEVE